jgi:hypothetical protein
MPRRKVPTERPARRPYRTPVLAVHGNLARITAAKGGGSNDGAGKPRTRLSGTNA